MKHTPRLEDSELPHWIRELLTRQPYSCSEPAYVHFRQDLLREHVIRAVDAFEGGREQLRAACRAYVRHEDPVVVERALACLFVVGLAADSPAVEPLLSHPDERIRTAAQTCLFELRRRPSEER